MSTDPTYVRDEIEAKPVWQLAFTLSEIMNDDAPIGWGKYIGTAQCLLANYDIKRKDGMSPLTRVQSAASKNESTPP